MAKCEVESRLILTAEELHVLYDLVGGMSRTQWREILDDERSEVMDRIFRALSDGLKGRDQ